MQFYSEDVHLLSGLPIGHLVPDVELIYLQNVCMEIILHKPVQQDLLQAQEDRRDDKSEDVREVPRF